MKRPRFTERQIISILKGADACSSGTGKLCHEGSDHKNGVTPARKREAADYPVKEKGPAIASPSFFGTCQS